MILITGGHGFLGNHTSPLISNRVVPSNQTVDLLDKSGFMAYVKEIRPTKILHLAARCGGIKYNLDNPALLIHDNTQMALNVFEAARSAGVSEVITIGSTCQYPNIITPPFNSKDMWNGYPEPSNGAYGISKRVICEIGNAYQSQYGINHKHVILANLYGEGDKSGHVIPDLIKKALNDSELEVWGDGKAKREFLYVKDAALIISELINTEFSGIVNVGSLEAITIHELAKTILHIMCLDKKIVFNHNMPNGQIERLLDSDFAGTTPIKEGLKNTIAWFSTDRVLTI